MRTTTTLMALAFGLTTYTTTLAQPVPEADNAVSQRPNRTERMSRRGDGPPPWAGMGQRRFDGEQPIGDRFQRREERPQGGQFQRGPRNVQVPAGEMAPRGRSDRGPRTGQGYGQRGQGRAGQGIQPNRECPMMNQRGPGGNAACLRDNADVGPKRQGPAMAGQRVRNAYQGARAGEQTPRMDNARGPRWQRGDAPQASERGPREYRRQQGARRDGDAIAPRGLRGGWNRPGAQEERGTAPGQQRPDQVNQEQQQDEAVAND